jgi:hypothetical protein
MVERHVRTSWSDDLSPRIPLMCRREDTSQVCIPPSLRRMLPSALAVFGLPTYIFRSH